MPKPMHHATIAQTSDLLASLATPVTAIACVVHRPYVVFRAAALEHHQRSSCGDFEVAEGPELEVVGRPVWQLALLPVPNYGVCAGGGAKMGCAGVYP